MAEKQGETTSTSSVEPNAFYAPYAQKGLRRADAYYKNYANVGYYPGQTYAGFDPSTLASHQQIGGLAGASRLPGQAADELGRTLSGQYLDPNTDPRFRRGLDTIENRIGSRFAASNRMGSGAFYNALADAETGAAAQLYGQERQRMMGGLALAPSVEAGRYAPAMMMAGVGAQREAKDQQGIDEQMRRYEWEQAGGSRRAALGLYGGAVNSSPYAGYATQSQTTPYFYNPAMQGIGMASAGVGLLGDVYGLASGAGGGGGSPGAGAAGGMGSLGPSSVFGAGGWQGFYGG